jgi:hypothetical protein
MGTNFYRVPTEAEMVERKARLMKRLENLDLSASSVANGYRFIEVENEFDKMDPWHEFEDGACIHLGKRSMGWKFLWNFNKDKYYSNKEELFAYIRSGRVVDEYGTEQDIEEFITMALEWGAEDGLTFDAEYERKQVAENPQYHPWGPQHYDRIIDDLRVASTTEFS